MTKVTAIIPSLYEADGEFLKLCTESLRSTVDWDIVVVTNGTKTQPKLDHIYGITRHLHTRDQGQCNAVNIAASTIGHNIDYLFIVNSDMYFAPTWHKNLRFDYPVFSPNLVEPLNNAGSAPPFRKATNGNDLESFNYAEVNKIIKQCINEERVSEVGFNLPLFIKKDLFDFLGGYDIAYDPWGSNSDTDLQTRINLAGITPWRLRDVLVYHFSNKTPTFAPENDSFRHNNFAYFKEKFGFDRDELGSDVWYNKDMLPEESSIKYKQDKYENVS